MNEIIQNSVFLDTDDEGYLISDSSAAKIVPPWSEAVDYARQLEVRRLGGRLHSLYLRGSVARGRAIAGRSDLDLFAVLFDDKQGDAGFAQAGIGVDGAEWLAARDVVAVGSDNAAIEVIPFDADDFLVVHKMLLVRRGIYLIEFLDLSVPAAEESWEGVIAVAPLKVTGATGSPVNPIFIS